MQHSVDCCLGCYDFRFLLLFGHFSVWKTNVKHMLNFYIFLPDEVKKILDKFYKRKEIQKLSADYGLDGKANKISISDILLLLRLQLCHCCVGPSVAWTYLLIHSCNLENVPDFCFSVGRRSAGCTWGARHTARELCVQLSFMVY